MSDSRFFIIFISSILALWACFIGMEKVLLTPDEAQYWLWSQNLDFGYFSKPPVVAWAIRLSTELIDSNRAFAIRIPSAVAYAVASCFIYLLASRLYNSRIAKYAAVIFATIPGVSLSSTLVTTDPFMVMFWSIALYLFYNAVQNNKMSWWLGAGMVSGFGLLAKYNFIFFLPSAFLYLYIAKPTMLRDKGIYAASAVAFLIFLPNIYWNYQHHFISFVHVARDNAKVGEALVNPTHMFTFVAEQFLVFSPIAFGVLLYILVNMIRNKISLHNVTPENQFLLSFILPMLMGIMLVSFVAKSDPHWASPIYVSASILIAKWLIDNKPKLIAATLAINFISLAAYHHYWTIADLLNLKKYGVDDPFKRVNGWDSTALEVSTLLKLYPSARLMVDERKLAAEMVYYARPLKNGIIMWNYDDAINNHFELKYSFKEANYSDWIVFVTSRDDVHGVVSSFLFSKKLRTITMKTSDSSSRTFYVYLLRGYKG